MTRVRGKEKEVDVDGGEEGNDWCLRARAVAIRDQQQWLAVANELAQSLAVPYKDLCRDVSILRRSKCHVRVFVRDVVIDCDVVCLPRHNEARHTHVASHAEAEHDCKHVIVVTSWTHQDSASPSLNFVLWPRSSFSSGVPSILASRLIQMGACWRWRRMKRCCAELISFQPIISHRRAGACETP